MADEISDLWDALNKQYGSAMPSSAAVARDNGERQAIVRHLEEDAQRWGRISSQVGQGDNMTVRVAPEPPPAPQGFWGRLRDAGTGEFAQRVDESGQPRERVTRTIGRADSRQWAPVRDRLLEQFPNRREEIESYRDQYLQARDQARQAGMLQYTQRQAEQTGHQTDGYWAERLPRPPVPFDYFSFGARRGRAQQEAADRIQRGEATEDDYYVAGQQLARQQWDQNRSTLGRGFDMATHLPGQVAERVVARRFGAMAGSAAGGGLLGTAVNRAVETVVSPGLTEAYQRHAGGDLVVGQDGSVSFTDRRSPVTAFLRGLGDQAIETWTEHAGDDLARGLGAVVRRVPRLAQSSLVQWTRRTAGGMSGSVIQDPLSEILEERLGDTLRGITGLADDYGTAGDIANLRPEALSQLAAEGLGFGAYSAARFGARRFGRSRPAGGPPVGGPVIQTLPPVSPNASPEERNRYNQLVVDTRERNVQAVEEWLRTAPPEELAGWRGLYGFGPEQLASRFDANERRRAAQAFAGAAEADLQAARDVLAPQQPVEQSRRESGQGRVDQTRREETVQPPVDQSRRGDAPMTPDQAAAALQVEESRLAGQTPNQIAAQDQRAEQAIAQTGRTPVDEWVSSIPPMQARALAQQLRVPDLRTFAQQFMADAPSPEAGRAGLEVIRAYGMEKLDEIARDVRAGRRNEGEVRDPNIAAFADSLRQALGNQSPAGQTLATPTQTAPESPTIDSDSQGGPAVVQPPPNAADDAVERLMADPVAEQPSNLVDESRQLVQELDPTRSQRSVEGLGLTPADARERFMQALRDHGYSEATAVRHADRIGSMHTFNKKQKAVIPDAMKLELAAKSPRLLEEAQWFADYLNAHRPDDPPPRAPAPAEERITNPVPLEDVGIKPPPMARMMLRGRQGQMAPRADVQAPRALRQTPVETSKPAETVQDLLEQLRRPDADRAALRERITKEAKLTPKQAKVLWARLPVESGGDGLTLEQTADLLGVSQSTKNRREAPRQLEIAARKKVGLEQTAAEIATQEIGEQRAESAVVQARDAERDPRARIWSDPKQMHTGPGEGFQAALAGLSGDERAIYDQMDAILKEAESGRTLTQEQQQRLAANYTRLLEKAENAKSTERSKGFTDAKIRSSLLAGLGLEESTRPSQSPGNRPAGPEATPRRTRPKTLGRAEAAQPAEEVKPPTEPLPPGLVGGGQDDAGVIPGPDRRAALAHASVDKYREMTQREPILRQASRADPVVYDRAMQIMAENPDAAVRLVNEILAGNRATTAEENAILLYRTVDLRTQSRKLAEKGVALYADRARNRADVDIAAQIALNDRELAAVDADLDNVDKASSIAGSEWGRSGRWRQLLMAEDYTLDGMWRRMTVAKGDTLTEKERTDIAELHKKIAELEKKLAEAETPIPVKVKRLKDRVEKQKAQIRELRIQIKKLMGDFDGRVADARQKKNGYLRVFWDIINIPRTIKSSIDFALFRQGGVAMATHPFRTSQRIPEMLASFADQGVADRAHYDVEHHPLYKQFIQAGGEITDPYGTALTEREEGFMSRYFDMDFALNLQKDRPIFGGAMRAATAIPRASQRSFITVMNRIRMDSFAALATAYSDRYGQMDEANARVLANYVNVMTGRGTFGTNSEKALGFLNMLFFAPKWTVSRFQMVLGQPLWTTSAPFKSTLNARKLVAMEYGRLLLGAGVVMALAAAAGFDVDDDPRSSGFGQIKINNTFIDLSAGLRRPLVLLSRIASGTTIDGRGKEQAIKGELLWRYFRTSLAPLPGAALDLRLGTNVMNQPTPPAKVATDLFTPIFLNDVTEAMNDLGVPRGTAASLLGLLGASVSTREPEKPRTLRR